MLKDTNATMIAALEAEISSAKRRLDAVYADTEQLKRDKHVLETDITRLEIHAKYLAEQQANQDAEIARKEAHIKELDTDIDNKLGRSTSLRDEVNTHAQSLELLRQEHSSVQDTIASHKETMRLEREDIERAKKEAESVAKETSKKAEKLSKVLTEIS